MSTNDVIAKVVEAVDVQRIIDWTLQLSNLASPTGGEKAVAEYLYEECRSLGLQCKLQAVSTQSDNVIGRLEGTSGGYELMFSGHIDNGRLPHGTRYSFAKPSYEGWGYLEPARLIGDEWIFGHDVMDMKGAFAAYLGAVDAIIRSDVRLKGSVTIAGVAGTCPTSSWTEGYMLPPSEIPRIGLMVMLSQGILADMCVLGEPSALTIVPAYFGKVRIRVGISGAGEDDPISDLNQVIAVLQKWIPTYRSAHQFQGVLPTAGIVAIQHRNYYQHKESNLYVELRTSPGHRSVDVVEQVRAVLRAFEAQNRGLRLIVEPLLAEPALEIDVREPVVQALHAAHERVVSSPPAIKYFPWSGDAIRLIPAEIPTVIYGPSGRWPDGVGGIDRAHYLSISDLATAARVYAAMAADVCSRNRS